MRTNDDALVALLDELVVLSPSGIRDRTVSLLGRLGAGDLRVALVGEAKRGKSTLGNAMLGNEVLPSGVVPVTALSTEVHTGSPRRLEVNWALALPQLPRLRYDFNPDIGWNEALVSGLRTHAPRSLARRRVADYLRTESGRLVDKHVGRARSDFQSRLEEASRRLRAQVIDAFNELTEGLSSGHRAATDMQRRSEQEHREDRARLAREREALDDLARGFGPLADGGVDTPGELSSSRSGTAATTRLKEEA